MTLPNNGRDGSPTTAATADDPEQVHVGGAAGVQVDIESAVTVLGQLLPLAKHLLDRSRKGGPT